MKIPVPLLLAGLLPCALAIAVPHPADELSNFDGRAQTREAPQALTAQRLEAASDLKHRIPGIEIDLDPVTVAPSWIRSTIGFLTGPVAESDVVPGITPPGGQRAGPPDRLRGIKQFLQENASLFGHGAGVLESARISREFVSEHNGMRTIVWEQELDGIPIFEGMLVGHFSRNGELVALSSSFLPDTASAGDAGTPNRQFAQSFPAVTAQEAVANAATNIGETLGAGQVEAVEPLPGGPVQRRKLRAPGLLGDCRAELVWLPMDRNTLRLCWRIILTGSRRNEMFQVLVDAQTGIVQVRHSWSSRAQPATYRVFGSDSPSPFSPGWSTPNTNQPAFVPQTNITLVALSTNASPQGWVTTNPTVVVRTNTTIGNNVDAHTDISGTKNYDYDVALDQATDPLRPIGTITNGILHFLFEVNLTNQTPATNFPARNQDAAVVNAFYWANWLHDKLYDFGFTEAAGNFQHDNFGRGGAGEDAVLIDIQNGGIITSNTAQALAAPIDGIPGRVEVGLTFNPSPDRDGAFDAQWLLHEQTHLMSARLVGHGTGISAMQTKGLDEGWADMCSLSLLAEAGDDTNATYAWGAWIGYLLPAPTIPSTTNLLENYYYGSRRYPYTTQMAKNPLTLRDARELRWHTGIPINPWAVSYLLHNPLTYHDPHQLGEIWCSALWEARAIYISKYGFSNGTDRILRLVMDGMKLGPANPTFLQARDAILLADRVTTGGVDQTNLWTAFAKRGMGWGAVSPGSHTTDGIVESFDLPPPDRKLWAYIAGNIVDSSPAIGPDGTIYVGSKDSKLYAINPDGTLRWTVSGSYSFDCSPAVGLDGTVYMGANDGYLRAITNGVVKWSRYLAGAIFSSPAIAADGTVYVGVQNVNSNVVAFSPDGTRLWGTQLGTSHYVYSSPAIGSNGTVYIGCMDGKLYALDPANGQATNSYTTGDGIYSSPAIGWDGSVYVGSLDGNVYAFTEGLSLKSGSWPFNIGTNIYCSPAISLEGTIYIGADNERLYSLNPDGSQRWSILTGNKVRSTPVIGADGTVFFGSYGWRMYSVATNGTTNWTYTTGFNIFSSPVIGPNGVLYVGSADSKLYALPANTYAARGQWPSFRRNLRHTGNVGTLWLQPGFLPPPDDGYFPLFELYGPPGYSCVVEESPDLITWFTNLMSFTLGSAGMASVQGDHVGIEFYRVKSGSHRSLNAIGSLVLTSPPSTSILMANPFNTADNTVRGLLSNVPEGTVVLKWSVATNSFVTNVFNLSRWSDETMTLRPGEGAFFINLLAQPLLLHLTGEILQGDLSNAIPAGVSVRSSMLPRSGLIQTNLGYIPDPGDSVQIFTNSSFQDYTFDPYDLQWVLNAVPSEPALKVGEAAFINSTNAKPWRQRYFVWP